MSNKFVSDLKTQKAIGIEQLKRDKATQLLLFKDCFIEYLESHEKDIQKSGTKGEYPFALFYDYSSDSLIDIFISCFRTEKIGLKRHMHKKYCFYALSETDIETVMKQCIKDKYPTMRYERLGQYYSSYRLYW